MLAFRSLFTTEARFLWADYNISGTLSIFLGAFQIVISEREEVYLAVFGLVRDSFWSGVFAS